jgi:redox-sensitive bicupin YhaK (pirin superfamily)
MVFAHGVQSTLEGMRILSPRTVPLGGVRAMTVRRTLPQRGQSTIGAWCFLDHFGPDIVTPETGMVVPPHPHTGLQTVTWLFAGEIEHRDSVGSRQLVMPGSVNLMTAGAGISHSEVSQSDSTTVHGVQLWVALPDADRHVAPFFEHHVAPRVMLGEAQLTIFVGELAEGSGGASTASAARSGATTFTPLVGMEIVAPANTRFEIPVDVTFEHGLLVDAGEVTVNGEPVARDELAFFDVGVGSLVFATGATPVRLVLIGGTPFTEELVMWWNFVGRTHEEMVAFRQVWQGDVVAGGNDAGTFGHVDYEGAPLPAPEMPTVILRPRRNQR